MPRRRTWLHQATGKSPTYWLNLIQREIKKASRKSADPKHDETDVSMWMEALVLKVLELQAGIKGKLDGNMRAAAVVSQILALWFIRVQRAKAYDPRRPIALRKKALVRWADYLTAMQRLGLDESADTRIFQTQRWESPWDPRAHDGDFI